MAKKNPPIETIGTILSQSLQRFELAPKLTEYGVWPIWNEVVGAPIAKNAQPEKIRNGTLFVKVTSPVWMQQLQFVKDMIVEKLNRRLKGEVVKNIFFIVGKIAVDDAGGDEANKFIDRAAEARAVDDTFLANVNDEEIRAAFKQLLQRFAKRAPKQ